MCVFNPQGRVKEHRGQLSKALNLQRYLENGSNWSAEKTV